MSALNRFTFLSTSVFSTSVFSTSALALGLGLVLSLTTGGCQQPQSYCTTAHGDFATTYTLTSGDPQSACGGLKGEVLGLQTYYAKGGANGTPKFSEPSMAIRPATLGELIDRAGSSDPAIVDPNAEPNALAKFTAGLPDDEEFCAATKFSVSEITLPELPLIPGDPDDPQTPENEGTPDIPPYPATNIRYEWSNARVLVSANYQGTQFSADLKFTQDGCTAEYEVRGLYPLIGCALDAECCSTEEDCRGKGEDGADLPLSGINPDFDVRCDTGLGYCVLRGDIPALR
ncbi:MAG: hypothetical protein H0T76_18365 [Nannocystis sp.]|nr:hypothetical protein [Nannocystis sp.]MBA3548451.1 hypothetical protein [Nannocystis sp.]